MMFKSVAIVATAGLLVAGSAFAQSAAYTWTGLGQNVSGATKCPTYKMTIDVTVEGNAVKGVFQQQGRDERRFEATLTDKGTFKTKAQLSGGATMDVTGTMTDKEHKVLLDGYCKFDAKLTKK